MRTKAIVGRGPHDSTAEVGAGGGSASSPSGLWILSAWQDLLLFVGTPLLIIPLITILRGYLTAADLLLYVVSFGAMGHHLPGMLRAYGDRELFARFRVRFVVAPVFLLAVCVFFAFQNLNGLTVMLLLWGTWHGMAQVYGFLRIYDAKVKSVSPWTARLDMGMCVAWFGLGLFYSPDRTGSIFKAFYDSGGPLIPVAVMHWLQSAWTVGTGCVTAAFMANWAWQGRQGRPPSLSKLLMMVSCFGFWWYTMTGVNNIILGIAMFEIFHDVQYLAIVWIYNVKRVESARPVGTLTQMLFRRSWFLGGLYVGLVFAYGYINLFAESVNSEYLKLTLLGLVSASTFLHFYYDGFIWKVREKSTREGLGLSGGQLERSVDSVTPGWLVHGLKWSWFVVPAALLATAEMRGLRPGLERQLAIVQTVPKSANAHNDLGALLGVEGRAQEAIEHLQLALQLNPEHARAHSNLANHLQDLGRFTEAVEHWQAAVRFEPQLAEAHNNWGSALEGQGRFEEAVVHFQQALRVDPENAGAHFNLGNALMGLGRSKEAVAAWQEALRIKPDLAEAHNNWGNALQGMGRFEEAVAHFQQALEIHPNYAEAHYNMGNALRGLGPFTFAEAIAHYREALRIRPQYAEAHNNLGMALASQGQLQEAIEHFQQSTQFDPNNEAARLNLEQAQALVQQKQRSARP